MATRWLFLVALLAGCGPSDPAGAPGPGAPEVSEPLQSARIYFGHQSVGRDVLLGISEISPTLRLVDLEEMSSLEGGLLAHSSIGSNGQPRTKDEAFLAAVRQLAPGDIAFYKYCYLDMGIETDPDELFARYAAALDSAGSSGIRTVAVTMPVTTVAPAWKRWLKVLLGRVTDRDLNAKRLQFNDQIRARYPEGELLDLARIQSTLEDGNRSTTESDGRTIEVLPPEYTDDGAHLNLRGRRHVAIEFIAGLENVVRPR